VRLPETSAVLRNQRGLALVELLVVLIVLAILLSLATASYVGYRERANDSAAQSNIHGLIPSMQAYFVDQESYTGMTLDLLKANYDAAIDPAVYSFGSVAPAGTTYCVQSSSGGRTWRKNGPSAAPERAPCP
jgi:type IV pilus assembly protein PilA